jgi:HCOMODA/2-hydroxy-3-carboxy-muconic semialdehyde decarboxylase
LAKLKALSDELVEDLLIGNKILFKYGVVDAFGHLSVRHDKDPEKYVMSRHLAPALVTEKDLLTYNLDSEPVPATKHRLYSERFIHGEIYKVRPDVMSIVHCHAAPLIPFGITKAELQPVYHVSAFLGRGVPKFDIRDKAGMTNMLVRTAQLGQDLAASLGDKEVVLMRGHGATMVAATIKGAVYRAM